METKLDINVFIKNFAAQFEETEASKFSAKTKFREEIEEWDSFKALSIIAMVDNVYDVGIKGEDIRSSNTIEDLFRIIKGKK